MGEFSEQRIRRLIVREEANFRRAFLRTLRNIIDSRTLRELADLLAQGRVEEALAALEGASSAFGSTFGQSVNSSGQAAAAWLNTQGLSVEVAFDVANERVVAVNRRNQLRLIREFAAEQRRAIRFALIEGNRRGDNPIAQARNFRTSIGLTVRQQRAVDNFRRMLSQGTGPDSEALTRQLRDRRFDRTIRRAIERGAPLSREQVDQMVARYRDRYIKYRSETIARTEALRSVHIGTDAAFQQGFDSGAIPQGSLRQYWRTAADERVRGSHASMHGQTKSADGYYVTGKGNRLARPGDPDAAAEETIQCRCLQITRIAD